MKHYWGRVEVICGSMFSGKTEELIRRVRRAVIAKQTIQVFKPKIDDRYGLEHITSHNGQNVQAEVVEHASHIINLLKDQTTVIAIDEAQFFEKEIVDVVDTLANKGLRVIVAGLDMDFRGEPFGSMPELLCRAEELSKLHAICTECGNPATRTQRLVNDAPAYYDDPIIMVGAAERYEARCRDHHYVPQREKSQVEV